MPTNNPSGKSKKVTDTSRETISRQITAAINEKFSEVLDLVKQTDSRTRVLFAKIHNLQAEIAAERLTFGSLIHTLKELLNEPQSHGDVEKIMKDFLIKLHERNKS